MIGKILTFVAILVSSICFAHEVNNLIDNELMDKIEANKYTCVSGYSEDKVYLKPARICPTEQGMYLNLNDVDYVFLPMLNSDSSGCYLPCVQILNICPGCGYEYFISCSRQDCPLVQRKQDREREKERSKEGRKHDKDKNKDKRH